MFLLPEALAAHGAALGTGWAGAQRMGAGPFCTNPGNAVLIEGAGADAFAVAALSATTPQLMMTQGAAAAMAAGPGVTPHVQSATGGQLSCTLHLDAAESAAAQSLVSVLDRKVRRILANGSPAGVEAWDAMVHGGPYPASTNLGATSAGSQSVRRFLRPVSYQNPQTDLLPTDLLPAELAGSH
jgi:2,5-dioxopentanoate dehydrogenase